VLALDTVISDNECHSFSKVRKRLDILANDRLLSSANFATLAWIIHEEA
jgi:hypothetical protein